MRKTLREIFTAFEGGVSRCRFKFACDDVADLPEQDSISGRIIDIGSVAYVVNTGETYMMNSDGDWVQKKTDGVSYLQEQIDNLTDITEKELQSIKSTLSDETMGISDNLISNDADLNEYLDTGVYRCANSTAAATVKNAPTTRYGFRLEVKHIIIGSSSITVQQTLYPNTQRAVFYMRKLVNNEWGKWYSFEGTEVGSQASVLLPSEQIQISAAPQTDETE